MLTSSSLISIKYSTDTHTSHCPPSTPHVYSITDVPTLSPPPTQIISQSRRRNSSTICHAPAQLSWTTCRACPAAVARLRFHYIFISYLFIVAFATTKAHEKPPSTKSPAIRLPAPACRLLSHAYRLPLCPYILNVDLKCVLMQFLTQILLLHIWLMSGLRTNFARCHAPADRLLPPNASRQRHRQRGVTVASRPMSCRAGTVVICAF